MVVMGEWGFVKRVFMIVSDSVGYLQGPRDMGNVEERSYDRC
jgi:hypothetical protein